MAFHAEFFNQIKSLAWFHKKPFMWTLCTVCLIPDHGLSITLIINWPTEQNAKPVSTLFNYFAHKFIEIKITIFLLVTHALNCCEGFFLPPAVVVRLPCTAIYAEDFELCPRAGPKDLLIHCNWKFLSRLFHVSIVFFTSPSWSSFCMKGHVKWDQGKGDTIRTHSLCNAILSDDRQLLL